MPLGHVSRNLFTISRDTNSNWETTLKCINSINLFEDTPNTTMNFIWVVSVFSRIIDLSLCFLTSEKSKDRYKSPSVKYLLQEIKQSALWKGGMQFAHQPYLYFKGLFLAAMMWKLQINRHQFPVLVWCEGDLSKSGSSLQYVPVSWTGECFAERHYEWQHTIVMWHDTKAQLSR